MSHKTVLCDELCASGEEHPEEWHWLSDAAPQVGGSISGAYQCQKVCAGLRGWWSTAQWPGSRRLAISQKKRTEKVEVFSYSLKSGLVCLYYASQTCLESQQQSDLGKIESKDWEAERVDWRKKQASMSNTALEVLYN